MFTQWCSAYKCNFWQSISYPIGIIGIQGKMFFRNIKKYVTVCLNYTSRLDFLMYASLELSVGEI